MNCCYNFPTFNIGIFIYFRVLRIIFIYANAIYYLEFRLGFSNLKNWLKRETVLFISFLSPVTVQKSRLGGLRELGRQDPPPTPCRSVLRCYLQPRVEVEMAFHTSFNQQ